MKKIFLMGVGFVLAVAVFSVAGFAYAQTQDDPPQPASAAGVDVPAHRAGGARDMRGGRMGGTTGLMGFGLDDGETAPLHDYLWPALTESFDLTDAQIDAFEIVRETLQGIRADFSREEIREIMQQAMATAIDNALADGAITEAQAEQMRARQEQMENVTPGRSSDRRGQADDFGQGFSKGVKFGRQMGLNHEYLDAAIADALGVSVAELDELRTAEDFSWQAYAEAQGLSAEEVAALRTEIFTQAVHAALEDETVTQEQADRILERLENAAGRGGGRP